MKLPSNLRAAATLLAVITPLVVQNLSAQNAGSVHSGPTTASKATLGAPIYSAEQVQTAVQDFRTTNEKLGKPRYLLVVTQEQISGQKRTVADLNRVRDVEQWVKLLFADAGATLVDPNVGVPLLGSKPYQRIPAADKAKTKKERDDLAAVADVVVEVTIVARYVTVLSPGANDSVYIVPDVTTDAYRVTDSALLGTASVQEVIKSRKLPEDTVMTINMNARTDTAIVALMEDIKRNLR